jgi:hypothetical protein
MDGTTKTKIGIGLVFALGIGGVIAYRALSGPHEAVAALPPRGEAKPAQVEVTMLYGSEKKEWVDFAAESFRRDHPEIKLTLAPRGSIEAAQAVLDKKERPTIFSPADSLVLNELASDWKTKGRPPLFATQGDEAPQSLVMTVRARSGGGRCMTRPSRRRAGSPSAVSRSGAS